MASMLPKIRVTDPQSKTSSSSREQAPTEEVLRLNQHRRIRCLRMRRLRGQTTGVVERAPPRTAEARCVDWQLQIKARYIITGEADMYGPLQQKSHKRTNTQQSLKSRSPTGQAVPRSSADSLGPKRADTGASAKEKEKKKGVSFLSRFIGTNKKKTALFDPEQHEAESDSTDLRPEGMDAQLFTQSHSGDNVGFNPRRPQPPGYIKVKPKYKVDRDFDKLFLAQELKGTPQSSLERSTPSASTGTGRGSKSGINSIWALEFSKDGKYLAAAGQDKIVRIWSVISSKEERAAHEKDEDEDSPGSGDALHLSAPVFRKKAIREWEGHASTIVDLSWSKNNFLLSSSFDKTVRLWHISRKECLCTFKHAEYVPSIQFHPRDDRFFLAGSLDSKLRFWSIPDKTVAFWTNGKTAIAGTVSGTLHFYDTEGLKPQTQIQIKAQTRGRTGSKQSNQITGIQAVNWGGPANNNSSRSVAEGDTHRDVKLLVSSKDSRIRLFNMRDKSQDMKFKGHTNNETQIRASLDDACEHVISGSEDRKAYIWSTGPVAEGEKADRRPLECFEANSSMTLWAILAPTKTRQLLGQSEDPVFDLCNPPPVTLVSRSESIASRPSSIAGGMRRRENGSDADTTGRPSSIIHHNSGNGENGNGNHIKKAEESPAYISRNAHKDGHILVTADFNGTIKVFRQDCAASKRKSDAAWDTNSIISHTRSRLSRTGSIATRGSASHGRARSENTTTQPPVDRIMSWRKEVRSVGSFDSKSGRADRSHSPRKSGTFTSGMPSATSSRASAGFHIPHPTMPSLPIPHIPLPLPHRNNNNNPPQLDGTDDRELPTRNNSNLSALTTTTNASRSRSHSRSRSTSPTKKEEDKDKDPLWLVGGQSNMFWSAAATLWNSTTASAGGKGRQGSEESPSGMGRGRSTDGVGFGEGDGIEREEMGGAGGNIKAAMASAGVGGVGVAQPGFLRPGPPDQERGMSFVSRLSSEESQISGGAAAVVAGKGEAEAEGGGKGMNGGDGERDGAGKGEEKAVKCTRCGGQAFKVHVGRRGERRLRCGGCGAEVA
ncbi:WD40 repeat-like protein [Aulographum hederae CBS 113979]|uniref:WD40 repeat-like protein n=1 Tax=Aulographum hederae CBS 113979 TaxID=1176131 RepID=A0A6G1GK89_9PEZI|nr:WD40 repeat-like protein [Aulographum hederae CBS 113979]